LAGGIRRNTATGLAKTVILQNAITIRTRLAHKLCRTAFAFWTCRSGAGQNSAPSSTFGHSHRAGVTILLVEQNANYALEAASSGYVLETGRVVLANDSASLRNDPEVQKAYLGT
jgi:hypothetical protein